MRTPERNCWSRSRVSSRARRGNGTTRIPKELERICLKALSKRASERYTTAEDMADDLRHFLAEQPAPLSPVAAVGVAGLICRRGHTDGDRARRLQELSASRTAAPSESTALKVIPKGLRSFDAHDADFFLELLPGPRDREGLPDGIRFWKTRIEETDPDGAFAVGLIYGPSGCGKSSLVRAGLLPRLSDDVIAVYVEATAGRRSLASSTGCGSGVRPCPPNWG